MATHSSIFAWRIPWREEPGGIQSMGSQSWTWLSVCACMHVHTHTHTHTPSSKQQGAPDICTKQKASIGRRVGQRSYQQKREKGLVLAQAISLWGDGRREWHGYQQTECFSSSGWWAGNGEGPHGTAQKIPEWLTKMTFLVKSCIKPWFGVMGFSANDTILDLRFSLNKYSILTKKVHIV